MPLNLNRFGSSRVVFDCAASHTSWVEQSSPWTKWASLVATIVSPCRSARAASGFNTAASAPMPWSMIST